MISLHTALLFRRLRSDEKPQRVLSQAVFDLFFKDMDRSLREMGASDLGVPKRIQKMGALFYGLLAAINAVMDAHDQAGLEAVLQRNIYSDNAAADPAPLARYLFAAAAALMREPDGAILAGRLDFGGSS